MPQSKDQANQVSLKIFWFPLTLIIVGASALLLFATSELIRERFVAGVTLAQTIDQIQTKLAISHLRVEEFASGDIVDLPEIARNIQECTELLNHLANETVENRWLLNSAEHRGGIAALASAREELTIFSAMSLQRIQGTRLIQDDNINSEFDTVLDNAFSRALLALSQLGELYAAALERNDRQSRQLVSTIISAWAIFISLAAVILWRRERVRFETETALQESEAQLNQAQKLDAVGRLAGGIAHDINNHLAAITMQCEIVKLKAAKGDPIIQRMDTITGIGEKSTELIRRLLAFSRQQPMQPTVVQMRRVIPEMEKMLTRLIGDDVQLKILCKNDLWNVLIDPTQLDQVLLNLIINARDAMPKGGEITVLIENRFVTTTGNGAPNNSTNIPRGNYVTISVSDQGSGIPPSVLDRIYEPFFTTKELGSNSGLGLATVHGIVEQNKGYIELETKQDVGTTFRISLPKTQVSKPPSNSKQTASIQSRNNNGTSILLIEDNQELREGTTEVLKELGYDVVAAADGIQGLKVFDEHHTNLDLVITDVVMPNLSGREVANTLRKRRPDIPIIFVSGYTDDVVLRHGVEAESEYFVSKPFSAASLAKKVDDVLSQLSNSIVISEANQ